MSKIMPFIDWNGNGKIDPVDIGISIVAEHDDEEDNESPPLEPTQKSGQGCLTTTLTFLVVAVFIVFAIIEWS
jgi:hypothetical protein